MSISLGFTAYVLCVVAVWAALIGLRTIGLFDKLMDNTHLQQAGRKKWISLGRSLRLGSNQEVVNLAFVHTRTLRFGQVLFSGILLGMIIVGVIVAAQAKPDDPNRIAQFFDPEVRTEDLPKAVVVLIFLLVLGVVAGTWVKCYSAMVSTRAKKLERRLAKQMSSGGT